MNDDELLDVIARRVAALQQSPEPVATSEQIAAVEARVGFRLPDLLRRALTQIGNGGYGPGWGILGTGGGSTGEAEMTADEWYLSNRAVEPDEYGWSWPSQLYPLCYWGCGIYSYVDCREPEAPVVRVDPNEYSGDGSWNQCIVPESPSLREWLSDWTSTA